jgi:hypothetical protein
VGELPPLRGTLRAHVTPLVPLHHNSSRLAACQQTPRVWAGRWWHLLLLLLMVHQRRYVRVEIVQHTPHAPSVERVVHTPSEQEGVLRIRLLLLAHLRAGGRWSVSA